MTLIPNEYQKGQNEAFELSRKEIDKLKAQRDELIDVLEEVLKIKRFDDYKTWEEGCNSTREYCSDGECMDAYKVHELINKTLNKIKGE